MPFLEPLDDMFSDLNLGPPSPCLRPRSPDLSSVVSWCATGTRRPRSYSRHSQRIHYRSSSSGSHTYDSEWYHHERHREEVKSKNGAPHFTRWFQDEIDSGRGHPYRRRGAVRIEGWHRESDKEIERERRRKREQERKRKEKEELEKQRQNELEKRRELQRRYLREMYLSPFRTSLLQEEAKSRAEQKKQKMKEIKDKEEEMIRSVWDHDWPLHGNRRRAKTLSEI